MEKSLRLGASVICRTGEGATTAQSTACSRACGLGWGKEASVQLGVGVPCRLPRPCDPDTVNFANMPKSKDI